MAGGRVLTPRRWRILSFLALHGSATTSDTAVVVGVSRLTVPRDLTWLHAAGLVSRERSAEHWMLSPPGGVSVAMTRWRMPSMVSNSDSCAPGWGRSRRTMSSSMVEEFGPPAEREARFAWRAVRAGEP